MLNKFSSEASSLYAVQANTLWAVATLNYCPPEALLNQLASHCQAKLDAFSPQNISNSVWAFATLNHLPVVSLFILRLFEIGLGYICRSEHGLIQEMIAKV